MTESKEAGIWTAAGIAALAAICGAALYLCAGCSIPATVPAFDPAPTSATAPEKAPETLCAWADRKFAEFSIRFGVPAPAIEFLDEPAKPVHDGGLFGIIPIGTIYHVGEYDRQTRTCSVWLKSPLGCQFSIHEVHRIALHEWLHHYDEVTGKPPPPGDHNDLFEWRIDVMGLDEDMP